MLLVEAIEPRLLFVTGLAGATAASAPPIPGNWSLAFADEFDGTSLGNVWTPHQYWSNGPTAGAGLEESDPANVAVGNGVLQLTARVNNAFGTQYTGGLVQAGGIADEPAVPTFSFLFGYAEAMIQVPAGAGLWPAFWMLPASHIDRNGEIDVMEMYDADATTVHGTVHRFGVQEQHADHTGMDLSAGWHLFGVDWEPDHITWYLDGTAYATTTDTSLIPTEAMFPIFDLGVGGPNNDPTADTPFPATMSVDYVHVWQQPAAPAVWTNPASLSVPAGQTATFSAGASGYPAPDVQWQLSTDGGATFADISGATAATFSFTAAQSQNGYEYQARFTNSLGAATSLPATLTVTTPVTLSSTGANPSAVSQSMTFTATVGGAVPDGELVRLADASNGNQVIATGMLSTGSAMLTVPAGTLSVGTHSLIALYAGDANFAPGQSSPYAQTVHADPPALDAAPAINGDNPNGLYTAPGQSVPGSQRSMVEDIVYAFSEPVVINDADQAFTLGLVGQMTGTLPANLYAAAVPGSNGKQWAVSLTGQPVGRFGSIANGEYSITLNPNYIFAASDGITPMQAGRTDTFYRLFGDLGGNRVVNAQDIGKMKTALVTYNAALDANSDGTVSALDVGRLKPSLSISYANDGFVTSI